MMSACVALRRSDVLIWRDTPFGNQGEEAHTVELPPPSSRVGGCDRSVKGGQSAIPPTVSNKDEKGEKLLTV